jgi:hypothetical protein
VESVDRSVDETPVVQAPGADLRPARMPRPRLRRRFARSGLVFYVAAPIILGAVVGLLAVRLL